MLSWDKFLFDSRTHRTGFWYGLFGVYILLLLAFVPVELLGGALGICASSLKKSIVVAYLLVPCVLLVRLAGRRLHDIGWPGWYALILLPLVFIRSQVTVLAATYYCDVSALTPVLDRLPPLGSLDLLRQFTATFNLSGLTVGLAGIAVPIILYLGFFPGVRGPNGYGPVVAHRPWITVALASLVSRLPRM
jgi:uncharacterized membrane protein YhaH (DUF805 family)